MGRTPCCDKTGVKRGKWTAEEDEKLINYIKANGEGSWRSLPKNAGLLRCGKSCRLRWMNYLRADVKRGNFSLDEEETIVKLHKTMGNKWSSIASHLPGRTDNEIKNYWNTHLSRTLYRFRSFGESMVTSKGSIKNKKHTDSQLSRRIESDKNCKSWVQKRARIEEKDPHSLPDGNVACWGLISTEERTSAFTMSPRGGEVEMSRPCEELDEDLLLLLKQFEGSCATDQCEKVLINEGIDKVLTNLEIATTSQEMDCGACSDAGNIDGCLSPTVSYVNNEFSWDIDELISIWSEEEHMSTWS